MKLDWTVTKDDTDYEGGDIHCLPNNDLEPHIEEGYCACEPRITFENENGRVFTHNAYDEREIVERMLEVD